VRHLGEGRSGRVALAFDSATAWGPLPRLLARYRAEHPAVLLEVLEDTTDGVLDAVRSRRAELGLVHLPPPALAGAPDPHLDLAITTREPLIAALPAALAAEHGDRADLASLAEHPFLVPPRGSRSGLHAHTLNLGTAQGDRRRRRL